MKKFPRGSGEDPLRVDQTPGESVGRKAANAQRREDPCELNQTPGESFGRKAANAQRVKSA
jgi:hypothetical protein